MELLERYRRPEFAAKVAAAERAGPQEFLRRLGPLAMSAQAPVLPKFGLPADGRGVERMKMSIHRRIAEGALGLEELANDARRALGLQTLADTRSKSAEEVLAEMASEHARASPHPGDASRALMTRTDDAEVAATRAAVQHKGHEGKISAAAHAYLEQQLRAGVAPAVVRALVGMAECGLPKAVLAAPPPLPPPSSPCSRSAVPSIAELSAVPSARAFFDAYVLPSIPVVLRGAADAATCPPMRDFADFRYLRRECGTRRVLCKSLAVDDADGRPVFVSDPELRLPLSAFLDAVEAAEATHARCPFYLGKVPLGEELPELAAALDAAPATPGRAFAACFGPLVPKGVFTYFGCNRNVTATHYDASENIMLCVCGTKRLWLYPPSDAPYLYPSTDPSKTSRAAAPPFRALSELPPNLQPTFREIAKASPVEVVLHAGDVLYLPACWWHCVEGSHERNMILNWWYGLHPAKASQDAGGPAAKWAEWVRSYPLPE